jgi:hypothetical protein
LCGLCGECKDGCSDDGDDIGDLGEEVVGVVAWLVGMVINVEGYMFVFVSISVFVSMSVFVCVFVSGMGRWYSAALWSLVGGAMMFVCSSSSGSAV